MTVYSTSSLDAITGILPYQSPYSEASIANRMWSASTVELSLASTSRSRAGGAHRPGARACEEKRPPREWIALGIPDGFALALPCESLQLRVRVKRLSYGLRRESCEEVTGIPLGVRGRVQLNEHARTRKDALRVVTGRASGSRGSGEDQGIRVLWTDG